MPDILWFKGLTPAEEKANTLTDKTGNGHDATLSGAASFFNFATRGKVLLFPVSTSGYALVAGGFTLNITQGLTVGVWLWRQDNAPAMILDRDSSFRLWFPDSSGKITFTALIGGQWLVIESETAIPTQQWIFIEVSFGPIVTNLYVHGSIKGVGYPSGAFNDTPNPIWIGRSSSGSHQFAGYIGEVLIKDAFVDLAEHRLDLKRWLKREQASVVELLELHAPGETLRFCSRPTPITLTVYDV
ncbi:MAG: LamG domain-containing protein [Magnetococcales bacterium]|nr:LamG domain-containing protein [Magnetococcales bacterium]